MNDPGFLTIPADQYHRETFGEPDGQPFLSSKIARTKRPVGRPPKPPIDRFLGFVMPEPNTGCWLWTSFVDPDGYAIFFEGRGLEQRAHRFAYKHFVGPIPAGLQIDHLCHTRDIECRGGSGCPHRGCVNPAHLEAVTPAENHRRGRNPLAARTHCKHGHEFTPENTYISASGRHCRTCHRGWAREWRAKKAMAA